MSVNANANGNAFIKQSPGFVSWKTKERQPGSCADIVITAYSRTHNSVAAFPLASPTDRNWLLCLFSHACKQAESLHFRRAMALRYGCY